MTYNELMGTLNPTHSFLVPPSGYSRRVTGLISWADVARCSLFVLKVELNTNQPIICWCANVDRWQWQLVNCPPARWQTPTHFPTTWLVNWMPCRTSVMSASFRCSAWSVPHRYHCWSVQLYAVLFTYHCSRAPAYKLLTVVVEIYIIYIRAGTD